MHSAGCCRPALTRVNTPGKACPPTGGAGGPVCATREPQLLRVPCARWLAALSACKIHICPRREKPVRGGTHLDIDTIQRLVRQGHYECSIHAHQERLEADLDVTEIEAALMQREMLEAYPEDPRGESCLV
jgi:hypothetical protein